MVQCGVLEPKQGEKGVHMPRQEQQSRGECRNLIDPESRVYGTIMHSHPSREGAPRIPRGPVMFKHTYHKLDSLTQAFPELPCP